MQVFITCLPLATGAFIAQSFKHVENEDGESFKIGIISGAFYVLMAIIGRIMHVLACILHKRYTLF